MNGTKLAIKVSSTWDNTRRFDYLKQDNNSLYLCL